MLKLGFLASHNGSNMQAVIDACREGRILAEPCVVISNNRDAFALQRAKQQAIPAYHLSGKTTPQPDELDLEICNTLEKHKTDLVILAGYLRKLGSRTLKRFQGRVINLHPALLPQYGGKGMFGPHVHAAVLASGDRETGVTVHVADELYDHGPILAQCRVPVLAGDTVESLAERLLTHEHLILVETLAKVSRGEIKLPGVDWL